MSKDYCGFENEDAKTAFLAGVIDVLSDNLSLLCDFPHTLDADIFYIENENISLLNDVVKKRLHSYNKYYRCNVSSEKIDLIDFKLKRNDCIVNDDFLFNQLEAFSDNPHLKDGVFEFIRELKWYLGTPICTYFPIELPDKNINTLAEIYLYIAYHYFFISFGEYIVLIIIGTVE